MSSVVLDASALLAFIYNESGAQAVADHLDADATVSAVNWSEVAQQVAVRAETPSSLGSGSWLWARGSSRSTGSAPTRQPRWDRLSQYGEVGSDAKSWQQSLLPVVWLLSWP